jgi:hypothetical protein
MRPRADNQRRLSKNTVAMPEAFPTLPQAACSIGLSLKTAGHKANKNGRLPVVGNRRDACQIVSTPTTKKDKD